MRRPFYGRTRAPHGGVVPPSYVLLTPWPDFGDRELFQSVRDAPAVLLLFSPIIRQRANFRWPSLAAFLDDLKEGRKNSRTNHAHLAPD